MPLAAIPTRNVVGGYPARCSEVATYVHITAADSQCPDKIGIPTTHAAAQGMPLAAIPIRYTAGRYPTDRIEEATYVYVATAYCHRIDSCICARQVKPIVPILITWNG